MKQKLQKRENPSSFRFNNEGKCLGRLKVLILPIGMRSREILYNIAEGISEVFSGSICSISAETLPIPKKAYNTSRRQYLSTIFLHSIKDYAAKNRDKIKFNRILGITDVDLYVPGLNFIFGEAQLLGEAAIISLYRLKPEFYGAPSNWDLFVERAVKEATHEIGHTLGLRHCPNSTCVMHFSLHIGMTDRKRREFCEECRLKVQRCIDSL